MLKNIFLPLAVARRRKNRGVRISSDTTVFSRLAPTLETIIDKRLGLTQEDDVMPEKCFEPYPGSTINHFMTKDFFEKVKQGVYERLEKEKNE